MEAPEKIYIPINNTIEPGFLEDYWVESPVLGQEVEYTKTDSFIEKVCEWFKSHGGFTIGFDGATVRDFLNFINK